MAAPGIPLTTKAVKATQTFLQKNPITNAVLAGGGGYLMGRVDEKAKHPYPTTVR